jgi:phage-related baseplate assembly protein
MVGLDRIAKALRPPRHRGRRIPVAHEWAVGIADENIASAIMHAVSRGDRRPVWAALIKRAAKRFDVQLDGRTLLCISAALAEGCE